MTVSTCCGRRFGYLRARMLSSRKDAQSQLMKSVTNCNSHMACVQDLDGFKSMVEDSSWSTNKAQYGGAIGEIDYSKKKEEGRINTDLTKWEKDTIAQLFAGISKRTLVSVLLTGLSTVRIRQWQCSIHKHVVFCIIICQHEIYNRVLNDSRHRATSKPQCPRRST